MLNNQILSSNNIRTKSDTLAALYWNNIRYMVGWNVSNMQESPNTYFFMDDGWSMSRYISQRDRVGVRCSDVMNVPSLIFAAAASLGEPGVTSLSPSEQKLAPRLPAEMCKCQCWCAVLIIVVGECIYIQRKAGHVTWISRSKVQTQRKKAYIVCDFSYMNYIYYCSPRLFLPCFTLYIATLFPLEIHTSWVQYTSLAIQESVA